MHSNTIFHLILYKSK